MPCKIQFVRFSLAVIVLISGNIAFAQKEKTKVPAPVVEPAPRTPYSGVKRDNLLNGLQVATIEVPEEGRVTCELMIRGGSAFDLVGKAGLAYVTAATLLAVDPQLSEGLDSLQAKLFWGVTQDFTWFRIETPAANLQEVISIVARLLVVDVIRPEAFKSAQKVALEMVKNQQESASARADGAFLAAVFGDHPYGHSVQGTQATLAAIRQGEVYDFYQRLYLANNMFAVVHGNLRHERVMGVFRMYFGGWIKGMPAAPTFRPPVRVNEVRIQKIEEPTLTNVEIRGGVLGVSHTDHDYLATVLLSRVLEKRLKPLNSSAAGRFLPGVLATPLHFSASVPSENALEFSRQATDIFSRLSTSEITESELAQAQTAVLKEHEARSVPSYLTEIAGYRLPETYPLTLETRLKAVSTLDLQRVAKRLLEANALTLVVLGKVNGDFKVRSE